MLKKMIIEKIFWLLAGVLIIEMLILIALITFLIVTRVI